MRKCVTRPFRHTITVATEMCGTRIVILGTYSSLQSAVRAAKKADASRPDGTREIRYGNWTRRNRYANGPVSEWAEQ